MIDFFIGILCVIGGSLYLFYLFKRRSFTKSDNWGLAMLIKGLLGGIGVIVLGIVLLISNRPF
jgi:uncharacterized membrane protein HdeD (DUF308 family)